MTWPARYGGGERSFLERYVVTEELLAAGAPVWAHWVADRQSGPMLMRYGREEVRDAILPRIVAGEYYFCIGMSEPDSGSDLYSAKCRAQPVTGGWKVDGRKIWTSNAHRSHYMIALLRTAPPAADNRRHGLTQFLVAMDSPGIEVRPIRNLTGDSDFNEVVFDDVFVPEAHLIGEVDGAWRRIGETTGRSAWLREYRRGCCRVRVRSERGRASPSVPSSSARPRALVRRVPDSAPPPSPAGISESATTSGRPASRWSRSLGIEGIRK